MELELQIEFWLGVENNLRISMSRASMLFYRPFQAHDSHLRLKFKEKGLFDQPSARFIHRVYETEQRKEEKKEEEKEANSFSAW